MAKGAVAYPPPPIHCRTRRSRPPPPTREAPLLHPWYAIRVRSNFEHTATFGLQGKGYEAFLPVYHVRRRWSDRVKELDLPLFPGYVFCRFDVLSRLPILTTPGVIGVVGLGKTPEPVPQHEIDSIQAILRSGLGAQPWPFLAEGARVRLDQGPLAGVEGIVLKLKTRLRLVVSVHLLQRSVAVEIERDWVTPVAK